MAILLAATLLLPLLRVPAEAVLGGVAPPASAPLLKLKQGTVAGAVDRSGVHRFLGVPYAAPPVGDLRWQPPKPRSWAGTRPATEYSASCAQHKNAFDDLAPGSEDCLYLNIFMPAVLASKPRPVMIFFYGGSDDTGSAMFPLYSGGNLVARSNDLVVVTCNYRLNAFGWLGGDALRGVDNSTGNWGLQDQRQAIRFVRSNAEVLGIDLAMLAIFGESAGAANTGAHLLSHRSRGLFTRAAMESGPPAAVWTSQTLSRASVRLRNLAKNAGCGSNGTDLAACLRTKNTTEIMAADHDLGTGSFPGLIDWSVVVDGVEFTDQLHSLAKQGGDNLAPVPVLLGSNRDEGSTFTHLSLTGNQTDYVGWLTNTLGASAAQIDQILALYPTSRFLRTPHASSSWWASSAVLGDYALSCPSQRVAEYVRANGQQSYLYFFDKKLALINAIEAAQKKPLGVCHGSELVLVFGQDELLLDESERELSAQVQSYWTNFARHGSPSPGPNGTAVQGMIEWPTAFSSRDSATVRVLGLSTPMHVLQDLKGSQCALWKRLGVIEPPSPPM